MYCVRVVLVCVHTLNTRISILTLLLYARTQQLQKGPCSLDLWVSIGWHVLAKRIRTNVRCEKDAWSGLEMVYFTITPHTLLRREWQLIVVPLIVYVANAYLCTVSESIHQLIIIFDETYSNISGNGDVELSIKEAYWKLHASCWKMFILRSFNFFRSVVIYMYHLQYITHYH